MKLWKVGEFLALSGLVLGCGIAAQAETFLTLERLHAQLPPRVVGRLLLEEFNCHRCHDASGKLSSRGAPDLRNLAGERRWQGLRRAILEPHGPMPRLLSRLEEGEQGDTAEAIAHFLIGRDDRDPENDGANEAGVNPAAEPEAESAFEGDAAEGRALFHRVGCVACYDPEATDLRSRTEKFNVAGLWSFLEHPLDRRPHGRMPDMQLSPWEARDLTAFLLRVGSGSRSDDSLGLEDEPSAPTVTPELIDRGRLAYARHGCVSCHGAVGTTDTMTKARGSVPPPWNEADLSRGCLSDRRSDWPDYALVPWQREAMRTALRSLEEALSPAQESVQNLVRFNCLACHERDGLGGVPETRDHWFTSENLNLGDRSRLPPSLTAVGAKLEPGWLRKVLELGASVRPYMQTRMPVFPRAAMTNLAEQLSAQDTASEVIPVPEQDDERALREAGHLLMGVKGFGCVSCHTYKGEAATTLNALDLTTMAARLRKGWFQRYLRRPQAYQPLTIMPSYWPNGVSTRPDILEGNPDRQIEALWHYLERGREARVPEGIRREPIVLEVADEAVMLRLSQNPGFRVTAGRVQYDCSTPCS